MRLSWAVLTSHTIILMLSGLSIGMEIVAFINDAHWNSMVDIKSKRFTEKEFLSCELFDSNDTLIQQNTQSYNKLFSGKKRDLPFELPFLGLMFFSFAMYLIVVNVYIGWKKIMPNIYICIVTNLVGTISHITSFSLILISTLIYSDRSRKYMGSQGCYPFQCKGCEVGSIKYERGRELHGVARACLEKLHVCQLSGYKDRIVYLLLGCTIASTVALVSSIRRLRRHKNRRIQPKKLYVQQRDDTILHPSMENIKRKSLQNNIDDNNISSDTGILNLSV